MSITELHRQLAKYWGRGGILSAADNDYEGMWALPDDAANRSDILWGHKLEGDGLDPTTFSRWVNRECTQWLGYFIAKNHTFGAVHAWFAAFLGVTRESLHQMAEVFGCYSYYYRVHPRGISGRNPSLENPHVI